MTKQETIKVLSVISAAYRREYKDMTNDEKQTTVALWHKAFEDIPFEDVMEAAQSYIMNDKAGFAPLVGAINAELEKKHPKSTCALNRRPLPQSFITTIQNFLYENRPIDEGKLLNEHKRL